jgi:cyclic lactone autoinducer peptide
MKKLLICLFEKFGGVNVYRCCVMFSDEIEIPSELLK